MDDETKRLTTAFGRPVDDDQNSLTAVIPAPQAVSGVAARQPYAHPNDDFVQAGNLYRDVMSEEDRTHLVSNIVGHLSGAREAIQRRQVGVFRRADPEYGARVAHGLGLDVERRTP